LGLPRWSIAENPRFRIVFCALTACNSLAPTCSAIFPSPCPSFHRPDSLLLPFSSLHPVEMHQDVKAFGVVSFLRCSLIRWQRGPVDDTLFFRHFLRDRYSAPYSFWSFLRIPHPCPFSPQAVFFLKFSSVDPSQAAPPPRLSSFS